MPLDQFFRFLEALNYSMVELLEVMEAYSVQLGSLDGKDVFNNIEAFCDLTDVGLANFFALTKQVFGTHETLAAKLAGLDIGMQDLYNVYVSWCVDQQLPLEDSFLLSWSI